MKTVKISLSFLCLMLFFSSSYAIDVSIRGIGENISAVGFSVNGKSYGGLCCSYNKKRLPAGRYSFGVRVNGVISGDDINCGSKKLKGNASIRLIYKNGKCRAR